MRSVFAEKRMQWRSIGHTSKPPMPKRARSATTSYVTAETVLDARPLCKICLDCPNQEHLPGYSSKYCAIFAAALYIVGKDTRMSSLFHVKS